MIRLAAAMCATWAAAIACAAAWAATGLHAGWLEACLCFLAACLGLSGAFVLRLSAEVRKQP